MLPSGPEGGVMSTNTLQSLQQWTLPAPNCVIVYATRNVWPAKGNWGKELVRHGLGI